LTAEDRRLLAFSGKLITLEIGLRFLTDWLEGDVDFKVRRPGHNLDRCRPQFALVRSIERQMPAMEASVAAFKR
ncbi:MAG: mucin desulfatase, partial [Verrucomicrobiota bacterium]